MLTRRNLLNNVKVVSSKLHRIYPAIHYLNITYLLLLLEILMEM